MTASPSPMTRCQDTIARTTLSVATGAVPPTANSSENTSAATGTLTNAATAAAGATTPSRLGSTARIALKTSQPTATPTSAIRVMLVPSAVMPPSAMNRAWTSSTVLTHSTAVQGPTSTAASVPPRRCPLVPAPTGKLIIWPAKTNVATRPAIGAVRSSSSLRAPRNASAMPPTAMTPVATEVGASRNPSGTCMPATLRYCKLFATSAATGLEHLP